jgi:hypothetical protein
LDEDYHTARQRAVREDQFVALLDRVWRQVVERIGRSAKARSRALRISA